MFTIVCYLILRKTHRWQEYLLQVDHRQNKHSLHYYGLPRALCDARDLPYGLRSSRTCLTLQTDVTLFRAFFIDGDILMCARINVGSSSASELVGESLRTHKPAEVVAVAEPVVGTRHTHVTDSGNHQEHIFVIAKSDRSKLKSNMSVVLFFLRIWGACRDGRRPRRCKQDKPTLLDCSAFALPSTIFTMASFVPNPNFDRENSNPKDWAYHLGCLPQKHHIVFTKEELVLYLKQHNISVGPNFTELSRLPKYATIGKLTLTEDANEGSATPVTQTSSQSTTSAKTTDVKPVYTPSGDVFRPSRKVRQLPGGGSAQVTALFGDEDEAEAIPEPVAMVRAVQPAQSEFEPLGTASARKTSSSNIPSQESPRPLSSEKAADYEGVRNDAVMNNGFRPTRRVR